METRRSKSEVIIELLQQRFTGEPGEKTPYELACETGFVGALELDENAAENSRHAVRAAIARKHGQAAE